MDSEWVTVNDEPVVERTTYDILHWHSSVSAVLETVDMDEKQEYFGKWYAKHRQESGIDYESAATVYPMDYTEAVIVKGYSHDQYVVRFGDLGARPYVIRRDGKMLTAEQVIALLNQVKGD